MRRSLRMPHERLRLIVPGAYLSAALVLGLIAPDLGWLIWPDATVRTTPASAIAMLSAIASGMMALTGIAFSLVLVLVQFASSAYTPRLLGELGRGRLTMHVLGVFTGTFLFASLAIRGVDPSAKLHPLVTWLALAWLLASVIALVLLIGSLKELSIGNVLGKLGKRGLDEISAHYPPYHPEPAGSSGVRASADALDVPPPTQLIAHAGAPLYIVSLDDDRLLAAARAAEGLIWLPHAVDDIVIAGDALAIVRGGTRDVPEQLVREAIVLDRDRTVERNPVYALRLLVDIAIRALSLGVNDPTTAVSALDQIEALLRAFACSELERGLVRDATGVVRVLYMHPSWEDLLSLGLTEIAQYGEQSVSLQRRLGALLADLSEHVPESRRAAVERWLERRQHALERAPISSAERAEAAGCDRQGVGHPLPNSR